MDREMNNLYLYDQNEYGDYGDIPPEFRPDERNMFTLKHSLVIKYFLIQCLVKIRLLILISTV